jgi:hypothetical protein
MRALMEILTSVSLLLIMNQNAIVSGVRLMQFIFTVRMDFKTPLHIQIPTETWASLFVLLSSILVQSAFT